MPQPSPLMPLLGVLVALVAGVGGLGAAESGALDQLGEQAQLTHQAKDAGHRRLAAAERLHSAAPAVITRAAATPISIGTVTVASPADPTQVPRFTKLELLVPLTTGVAATSFYNPNPAAGGITLVGTFTGPSASWNIPGFYDGTNWRIRFAADTVGAWSYVVSAQDPSGSTASAQGTFTVVANPGNHGWVKTVGNHLAYSADGTTFFGIGHNNGWLDGVEQPPISAMPGIGENVLSFWLANPFGSVNRNPIEESSASPYNGAGIGVYNQTSCQTIDALFADAEAAGVLLLPSIWAHNQLNNGTPNWGSPEWPELAYSQIIDPATSMPILASDFFKILGSGGAPTAQWTYQENFYRYLIARWGYSTSLLGWVGEVELNGTAYIQDTTQGNTWCGSVTGYFALNDPYRGTGTASGAYPISFSMSDQGDPDPFNQGFSMLIMDSYLAESNSTEIATTIASETSAMHALGLPCFISEFGALVTKPNTLEPWHFHNAMWAGISSGGALAPLKYCDGNDWPLISDPTLGPLYQAHLKQLAAFLQTVPYAGSATVVNAQLAVSGLVQNVPGSTVAVNAWGQALSDRAFAWVQAISTNQTSSVVSSGTLGNGTLSVSGLTNGIYQATWYDPWGPTLTPGSVTTPTASGGTLSLAIPASPSGNADLVLSLHLLPSATAQTVSVVAGTAIAITLTGSAGNDTISGTAIASLPSAGTLNQTSDGVTPGAAIATAPTAVTYTPPAAAMVLYTAGNVTGSDSFTFTVADGALVSPPATVQVQIIPVNLAPTFTAGPPISLNENVLSFSYPGWASAISNGPGDTSTLTGFTVTTDQPGMFTQLPAIDLATGTLSFSVNANVYCPGNPPTPIHATAVLMDDGSSAGVGGANASIPAPFNITINQVSLQPVLAGQSLTTYPSYPLIVALNGSVPDHAPLTYAITHSAAHGTVTVVSEPPAQATYTATAGYSGADSFVVQATDVVGGGANLNSTPLSTYATIALTVTPAIPPLAVAQSLTVPENQGLGIVLAGSNPGQQGGPLTFAIASPPAHGTLSDTPPSVTYTPQTDYVGADSFTYTASDGVATSAPATVRISVLADGSGSSGSSGRCGSGNGFAGLVLLAFTLGSGWLLRRPRPRR